MSIFKFKMQNKDSEIIAETGRVEAFSDAVIAIIMTLLVIELHVPELEYGNIGRNLSSFAHLLPQIGAFALSFVALAVIWVNHHHFFHALKGIDKHLLWHNNHLLFWVCMIPFVTNAVGQNLAEPLVTALYGGVMVMMSIAFSAMIRYAYFRSNLLPLEITLNERCKSMRRSLFGPIIYFIATVLSFFLPWLSIVLYVSVMVFYFLPKRFGEMVDEVVGGVVVQGES